MVQLLKGFENLSSTNKDEATKFLTVVMKKFDLLKREMRGNGFSFDPIESPM